MEDVMRGTAQEQASEPLPGRGLVVSNDQAVDVLLACHVQQFVSRATNPDNSFDMRAVSRGVAG